MNLRKILLDFADYENWSDYLPFCQMIANSNHRKSLNASPYELMFGSDVSPRLLPVDILKALEPRPDQPDVPDYLTYLSNLSSEIINKWKSVPVNSPSESEFPEPKFVPQPGSRVFVLRESPNKLHGQFVGPYIVKQNLTRSSLLVENLITTYQIKTSIHLIKPCLSSLPDHILNAYLAADAGELLIDAILDVTDGEALILYLLPDASLCCPNKTVYGASLPAQNAVLAAIAKASRSLYDDRTKKPQSDRNRPRLKKDMISNTGKLTETHKACTHRATHHPNYIPLNERYDEPAHEWDIVRAGAKINPAVISSCVDTDVISTLAMFEGVIIPGPQLHQINDEKLWENILFASQFPYLATAKLTLSKVEMD
ncbi:hypothetical protein P9112_006137 [Eukaryota sp. TZLM1-RC]